MLLQAKARSWRPGEMLQPTKRFATTGNPRCYYGRRRGPGDPATQGAMTATGPCYNWRPCCKQRRRAARSGVSRICGGTARRKSFNGDGKLIVIQWRLTFLHSDAWHGAGRQAGAASGGCEFVASSRPRRRRGARHASASRFCKKGQRCVYISMRCRRSGHTEDDVGIEIQRLYMDESNGRATTGARLWPVDRRRVVANRKT